jgi:hypothetical protein
MSQGPILYIYPLERLREEEKEQKLTMGNCNNSNNY